MAELPISTMFISCLNRFNQILSSEVLLSKEAEVPLSRWEDELGRLRVWASNIGAHQKGQSSLDYRLRDASFIKSRVIEILRDLKKLFNDLEEVLAEPAADDDDDVSDDSDDEFDGKTEVQLIYEAVLRAVTCLFRMSMAIRHPAPLDRILGSHREDITAFEPYDRLHVRDKFPRADNRTIERLGSAISRRRAALRYRERHRAKLSHGINSEAGMEEFTTISGTVVTVFLENLTFGNTHSDAGASQVSYARSLFESKDHLVVPPRPKESADENPFECPYCYFIITVKDRNAWAKHIFFDLLPYMCIFPDCHIPNKLFASRHEWYSHIEASHWVNFTERTRQCPLCKDILRNSQMERQHLAHHLEDLALFALPVWNAEDVHPEDVEQDPGVHGPGESSSVPNPSEGPYGSLRPLSYWSAREQQDFPELVAHFGKDFEAMSQFMKTKTPIMLKKYFQARVCSGKTDLEEKALVAEAKKSRGEPTGPLPALGSKMENENHKTQEIKEYTILGKEDEPSPDDYIDL